MNFSSTNFPRSLPTTLYEIRSHGRRQAVATVITFLPSFRCVFLSHNQVTILITFAFLTADTERYVRFILYNGYTAFTSLTPAALPGNIVFILCHPAIRGMDGLSHLHVLEINLNSFEPLCSHFLFLSLFLSAYQYPSTLPILFHYAFMFSFCFFFPFLFFSWW